MATKKVAKKSESVLNETEIKKNTDLVLKKSDSIVAVDGKNKVEKVVINNAKEYAFAIDQVNDLNGVKKKIDEFFDPIQSSAYQTFKGIVARHNQVADPVVKRIKAIQLGTSDYLYREEEKRRKEQERLDRLEAERIRKEEEKLAKAAEKARVKGDEEKAQEIEDRVADIDRTPQIAVTVPKTVATESGAKATRVMVTEVKIIDMMEFLKEVVEGRAPLGVIQEWYNTVSKNGTTQPKSLTNFVKLGMFKQFPGLAIREVPQARFGGRK